MFFIFKYEMTYLNWSLSIRDCWPIFDKKQEFQFRKVCNTWLTSIQKVKKYLLFFFIIDMLKKELSMIDIFLFCFEAIKLSDENTIKKQFINNKEYTINFLFKSWLSSEWYIKYYKTQSYVLKNWMWDFNNKNNV